MIEELLEALKTNGLAIHTEVTKVFIPELQKLKTVFQLVEQGNATEPQVEEAIASLENLQNQSAKIGDTVLKTLPNFLSPTAPSTVGVSAQELKSVPFKPDSQFSFTSDTQTGLPGTVNIDIRSE